MGITAEKILNDAEVSSLPLATAENRGLKILYFKDFFAICDFLLALTGWMVLARLYGGGISVNYIFQHWSPLFFSALLTILFFPSYQLYSRHLIFSISKHLSNALKALFCASGCFAFLSLYYTLAGTSLLLIILISLTAAFVFSKCANRAEPGAHFEIFRVIGICLMAAGFLGYVNQREALAVVRAPLFVTLGFILSASIVLSARLFLVHVVFNNWLRRIFRRQVVVLGSDEQARRVVDHVVNHNAPFYVAGVVGRADSLRACVEKHCLGPIGRLPELTARHKIDELIVTDRQIGKHDLIKVLDFCLPRGIAVWLPPNLMPIIDQKLHTSHFCGLPMVELCVNRSLRLYDKGKLILDWALTLLALTVLMPLFGLIAAAIRLTSAGPAIYRSIRIGQNGREFKMLKFRTMRASSDDTIHKEFVIRLIKGEMQAEKGRPLKIVNDPRITPVGHFLRKTSLDELPQLLNVLKGEMSLVGPRPCLPYEFEAYQDWYKKRTCVRPGITGMWQVAGRSNVVFEDMILLDLYYIYNRSLWMDLNILIETVFVLLNKKGGY